MTVVRVIGQRLGMQHEQAAGRAAIVGDDGGLHPDLSMDHARVARGIDKRMKRFAPIYPASNWGLFPRAIMDIRPLLSSITRRPQ